MAQPSSLFDGRMTIDVARWIKDSGPDARGWKEALALRDAFDEVDWPTEPFEALRENANAAGWSDLLIFRTGSDLALRLDSPSACRSFSETIDRRFKPEDREWDELREAIRMGQGRRDKD